MGSGKYPIGKFMTLFEFWKPPDNQTATDYESEDTVQFLSGTTGTKNELFISTIKQSSKLCEGP